MSASSDVTPEVNVIREMIARAQADGAPLLIGEALGFAREDVALVRAAANGRDSYTVDEWERWSALAAKLAALRPPPPPPPTRRIGV